METHKCEPIFTLSKGQRHLACSTLLTTRVATHPDLGRGYLVFLTFRWPILHADQQ